MNKRETKDTAPQQIHNLDTFPWDPMGSYTGRAYEAYEVPVQDADDL